MLSRKHTRASTQEYKCLRREDTHLRRRRKRAWEGKTLDKIEMAFMIGKPEENLSVSAKPDFINTKLKTKPEDEHHPFSPPVISVPIKEETQVDILFDDNPETGQRIVTCYHCGRSWVSLEEQTRHIKRSHKLLLKGFDHRDDFLSRYTAYNPQYKKQEIKPKLEKNTTFLGSYAGDASTKTSTHMLRHMVTHSKNQTSVAMEKKKYDNLKIHIMSVHKKEMPYQCPYCDYAASQKGGLKIHMSVHTKEKPYQCHHCDYAATQSGDLKIHIMYVHKKEKPYQCSHCDFTATLKSNLKRHIVAVHTKKKPYQCPHCDYTATLKSNLTRHIVAVHTKEKYYKWFHCDYAATQPGHLKRHIIFVHTKEKPY